MHKELIVVAIGGNSLIKDESHKTVEDQYKSLVETCKSLVDIIEEGYSVVITHGNGPQVGFILRRSEIAYEYEEMHMVPISSCVADTQGAIGFQLQMALDNEFRKRNIKRSTVTIITRTLVDKNDEAFKKPTKPIGSFYSEKKMFKFKKNHPDWEFMEDAGRGYRRIVPSPEPLSIIELDVIKDIVSRGHVLISAGGGGIGVIREDGYLKPSEVVIDKDLGSALLAIGLKAKKFIISTSVSNVCLNYKTPEEINLECVDLQTLKDYKQKGHFKVGSMLPKIEAAIKFIENTGESVIITSPDRLLEGVKELAGTIITK